MSRRRRSDDLDDPTFFADENLSRDVVEALRESGAKAEHFFDHFERGTADEDWLPEVGNREWFVLSRDARQRRRPAEIDAIKRACVGQFILRGQSIAGEAIVRIYTDALPKMRRRVSSVRPPFIYHLNAAGKFTKRLASSSRAGCRMRLRRSAHHARPASGDDSQMSSQVSRAHRAP